MTDKQTPPAELIEAMARAIADNLGIRPWSDTPVDHGDLRRRIRDRENYDVNEPSQWDYLDAATAALAALRETLVPWGYAVEEEGHPIISYVTREKPTEPAINVTPLYALPEVKP